MDNFRSQSCPKTFCKSENKNHAASEDSELGELSKVNDLKRYFPKSVQLADIIELYDNDLDIFGESEQMNLNINENIEHFSNKNISNENTATIPACDSRFIPLQQENLEIPPSCVSDHEEEIENYSTKSHSFGLEKNATKSHIIKANMRDYVEKFTSTSHEQVQVKSSNSIGDSSNEYRTGINIRIPENFSKMDILQTETSDSVENYPLPSTQIFPGSSLLVNEPDSLENLNRFQSNSGIQQNSIVERNLNQFFCSACQREFKSPSDLRAHMLIHLEVNLNECDICGKSFTKKPYLQAHVRRHKSDKLFVCATCGKSFQLKYTLKTHELVHTSEKPFACATCGKSFKLKFNLTTHELVHTGEKKFACETCGKLFNQMGNLKIHERVHTGEKPFVCDRCGKPFTHKYALQQHVRVHTGERLFSCEICGKSFKYKSNLKTHGRVHEGHKQFISEISGKPFTQSSTLKTHVRLYTT